MRLFPIYIDGDTSLKEVMNAFESAGFHVRIVGSQVIAKKVPPALAKTTAATPAAQPAGRKVQVVR